MSTNKSDIEMSRQFDLAEAILARSGMHPVMAHAVIDFARYGEQHVACGSGTHHGHEATVSAIHQFMSTRQAAVRLGVSEKQVYRLVASGRLRGSRVGRHYRFSSAALDALLKANSDGERTTRAARRATIYRDAA